MLDKFCYFRTILLIVLTSLALATPTMAKFGKDPSWATWSTKDVARAAGFTLLETVGTVIDYGEAYARRGLRASGVSANAAQDITDGVFFLTNVIPARAGIKLLTQATRSVRIEHRARYALDLAVARDTRVVWGRGIQVQGMPWEDYIAQQMSTGSRLPAGFKTFDFYDRSTKTATSVKTLNTLTEARLSKPESIYSSLKKSIDDTVNFPGHRLDGTVLTTDMIQVKRLELAIPKGTPAEQMVEVLRAVDYAEINGVIMKVTVAP